MTTIHRAPRPTRSFGSRTGRWALGVGLAAVGTMAVFGCSSPRNESPSAPDMNPASATGGTPAVGDGEPPTTGGGGGTRGQSPPPMGTGGSAGGIDAIDVAAPSAFGPERPNPDPFFPLDGERLKVRWAEGAPNARTSMGWRDTKLGIDCFFGQLADGSYRCLPSTFVSVSYFIDTACTARAAIVRSGGCLTDYVRVSNQSPTNRCLYESRIHQLGAPYSGTLYYKNATDGICRASRSVLPSEKAFAVGKEAPPDTFVRATPVWAPESAGATGYDLKLMQAEDGARGAYSWMDRATDMPCPSLYSTSDRTLRCLSGPLGSAADEYYYGTFSDAACGKAVAPFYSTSCAPPKFVTMRKPGICPEQYTLASTTTAVDKTYSRDADDMCTANDPTYSAGTTYYSVGAPVAEEGFPTVASPQDEPTGNRLRRQLLASAGGRRVWGGWFDTTLNASCFAAHFGANDYRCLPGGTGSVSAYYFADAACTRPLWQGYKNTCVPKYATNYVTETCPPTYSLVTVGARHTGAVYYRRTAVMPPFETTCTVSTPSAVDLYHAVSPAPDALLARLKVGEGL